MDGMKEIRFCSKALFVGFNREKSLCCMFSTQSLIVVQKIFRGGAVKIHSLKYHFQMIGTGYSYHPALFL